MHSLTDRTGAIQTCRFRSCKHWQPWVHATFPFLQVQRSDFDKVSQDLQPSQIALPLDLHSLIIEPMCIATPTPITLPSASSTMTSSRRSVSFAAPQVFTVDRMQLSFYNTDDFRRFRMEKRAEESARRKTRLMERRNRGVPAVGVRRTKTDIGELQDMRSHVISLQSIQ